MFGYYFRREDETPGVVADAAFAAFVQLFIPFPYNEPDKNFKKSLYFFIDRELFGYTDVISLSFCEMEGAVPVEISPLEALIYRFATAYFLHCMVNRKMSSCKSEFNELTGSDPDAYLLDELFKAANNCCNNHAVQKWLMGASDTPMVNPDMADLDRNGIVDVFDLARMKHSLLSKSTVS